MTDSLDASNLIFAFPDPVDVVDMLLEVFCHQKAPKSDEGNPDAII